ncbi:ABC transporter substrate-binding protein [Arthrobacter sp. H14]|uniref:ABC transporter substrate-binding protein n=1 Tax=Arthrobacter sp. H14 TaxID=1312959 RepID=UPI00047DD392|nr:extracellular solute-binding protein [Arthrobacter sp. H14]
MKTRKTRSMATAIAAATLSLSLAACGSSGPADTGGGNGETTMWSLTGGPEPVYEASVERWNENNPEQPMSVSFFANDAYKNKIRSALGAGQGPTFIFGWGGGVLESYVETNKVMDLTGFLENNPDVKDRFLPSVLENGVVDGKNYALPNNSTQPKVLYHNKQLFEEIGAQPPETWDELMALVPRFEEAGIAPISLGGQSKWTNLMWMEYLVDRIGGPEVFDRIAANEPGAWSDPAVIEALTKIQDLVEAGGFIDGFSSIAADSGADVAPLYTGKAAMLLQGSWVYTDMKTAAPEFVESGDLGWSKFPAVKSGEGHPDNIVGNPSNFWSINADGSGAQKETAKGYLKDTLFDETYIQEIIETGAVPPVKGIEDELQESPDSDFLTFAYEMAQEAPTFQLSWDQALSPGQADTMLTNLDLIFLGEITPKQFTETMNGTIEQGAGQ